MQESNRAKGHGQGNRRTGIQEHKIEGLKTPVAERDSEAMRARESLKKGVKKITACYKTLKSISPAMQ